MTSRTAVRCVRLGFLVLGGAIGTTALAGPALAQDSTLEPRNQIVLTGRLVVASDETVDAAVILDGDAQVDGTVSGSLVVLNGDAEVSGRSRRTSSSSTATW